MPHSGYPLHWWHTYPETSTEQAARHRLSKTFFLQTVSPAGAYQTFDNVKSNLIRPLSYFLTLAVIGQNYWASLRL